MKDGQASRSELLSWLYVGLALVVIFATIAYARPMRDVISEWADDVIYMVIAFVSVGAAVLGTIFYLIKSGRRSLTSYVWLAIAFTIFAGYVIEQIKIPVEALHFLEYGVLGIFLYRALSHRVRDRSVFLSVAVLGAAVGTLDEFVQWLMPGRFWDLHDIWIDFFAVLLTQLGIAKGISPAATAAAPTPHGLRWLCRTSLATVILLALSALNTPAVVAWYADRVAALEFLKYNNSTMIEFGYFHEDPTIGFNSRFSLEELRQTDLKRGQAAGAILERYSERAQYGQFLMIYTPMTDPFLHEAGVHLGHRDNHMRVLTKYFGNLDEAGRAYHAGIGYRENQILEAHFPETLKHSKRTLAPANLALARANTDADAYYFSWVSKTLITSLSKTALAVAFVLLAGGLIVLDRYFAARQRSQSTKRHE